jgi:hypothetical protein
MKNPIENRTTMARSYSACRSDEVSELTCESGSVTGALLNSEDARLFAATLRVRMYMYKIRTMRKLPAVRLTATIGAY